MTAPKTTREEAVIAAHVHSQTHCPTGPCGTAQAYLDVVALYDALDAALSDKIQVAIDTTPLIPPAPPVDPAIREEMTNRLIAGLTNERAMRECIDRLRDGFAPVLVGGLVWSWVRTTWDQPEGGSLQQHVEAAEMTPEQQAVMAR